MRTSQLHGACAECWELIAARYPNYELVTPWSPSFVCQAEACIAQCCKRFSVSLGEREVERMQRVSGFTPLDFLEVVDGSPLTMPLAQPYLLARREGKCVLLGELHRCTQYEGRPDACRLYPHFVLFVEPETGKPTHADAEGMKCSLAAALQREAGPAPYVPLLIRHLECPGFTGPALGEAAWLALLAETARLQYADGGEGWD
ncbi:MAG: YkgJ family cysteine cluster protein [Chloroflexi bacterium]|nr:YkgJ family cysteine cluster protein [Chloroflexota bacterium]